VSYTLNTPGEVKFCYTKSIRQKIETQVWSKTQLKTELDLVTKRSCSLNMSVRFLHDLFGASELTELFS